eukprot:scaffold20631_cov65-Phaeocystis_antarctica.AAC.2
MFRWALFRAGRLGDRSLAVVPRGRGGISAPPRARLPSPHAVPVRVALPRRVRRSPAYAGSPRSPCRRARAPRAGAAARTVSCVGNIGIGN